jgi:sn-glycerol 3-phosphate transport system substrate-binding protein
MVDSGNSITAFSLGASDGSYSAWTFMPAAWQWGGEYSTPDLQITINSPEVVAAAQYFQDGIKYGWAYATDAPEDDFSSGLSGAILASTGSLGGMIQNVTDFEFGTAFLPEGPAGFGCCTGGAGLSILKSSAPEKQAAAFAYAAWKTSAENTASWSQTTGYMPVRKSAIDLMADYFATNPNAKVAVDQLAKTRSQDAARVQIPNGDQIIGEGLGRIIVGTEDVQSVLDDVAQTLTEEAAPVIEAIQALGIATPTA